VNWIYSQPKLIDQTTGGLREAGLEMVMDCTDQND
jgi:hypothetical protein